MKFLCALQGLLLVSTILIARADDATITVDPAKIIVPVSPYLTGVCMEDVNHEVYGGIYDQMIFGESFQEPEGTPGSGLSRWWKPVQKGTAQGKYELIKETPFVGVQSQRIKFLEGDGQFGISNAGLNGQGINIVAHQAYRGVIWTRTSSLMEMKIAFTDMDGTEISKVQTHLPSGDGWIRTTFGISSQTNNPRGRLQVTFTSPGSVDIGYVYLDQGPKGQFANMLVRRDVAQKLIDEGVTVMRYGGSMVNAPEYRWKKMLGSYMDKPRQPYHGTWYPYSSNGWGIPEFCDFCDAAGFMGIPDFNINELPQDMADFVEYAHGSPDTNWGQQRVDNEHYGYAPANFSTLKVHVIELGNEEKVDEEYWKKFEPIARAIWSKDPTMILTVGDFSYDNVIIDPMHVTGGHVDSLAAHQKILALAKKYGAEVWFDVHIWDQEAAAANSIAPLLSYIDALKKLSNGAKFHVVTYELNANKHDLNRALANARMIGMIERAGAEPVVTSANALQVDGQNDNGWDQGLIFMNPEKVWVQPPGYVMQMISQNRLADVVHADCSDPNLDVTATANGDEKTSVLQVVNCGDTAKKQQIEFLTAKSLRLVKASELSGALDAVNTAATPEAIKPAVFRAQFGNLGGEAEYTFPPHSFTVLLFQSPGEMDNK